MICRHLTVFLLIKFGSDLTNCEIIPEHQFHNLTEENSGVWCAQETLNTDWYGTAVFPKTAAVEGCTEVKVGCPYGNRHNGFQNIYDGSYAVSKDLTAASSGVLNRCCLMSTEKGEVRGVWDPPLQQPNEYCRFLSTKTYEDEVKRILTSEVITPILIRQLKGFYTPLKNCAALDYLCGELYVNSISYLLSSPKLHGDNILPQEERLGLMSLIRTFGTHIGTALPPGFKHRVGDDHIVVETVKFHGSRYDTDESRDRTINVNEDDELKPYSTRLTLLTEIKPSDDNITSHLDIVIPVRALRMSFDQSQVDPKLQITLYSENVTSTFWRRPNPSSTTDSTTSSEEEIGEIPEKLGILSIDLNGLIENLTEPVKFIISSPDNLLPQGYGFTCAYWDTNAMSWSEKGMTTTEMQGGVMCSSTHLTAFSALIEPLPLPFPDADYAPINNSIHAFILSILSSIGSVCSIIGLSFTLLTYALFRSLRRERSNRILLNLCASLLFLHIMSLSGSKNLWDGYCFVPAASMHYLVLTSFSWMMVEAIHMFELLISVFVRPENRFLLKRVLGAWGVPLIVVIICTTMDPKVYKVGRADLCLMSAHANIIMYYIAYIGPVCIMLLVNLIIFCKIFRVLYQQTKRTKGQMTSGDKTKPKFQFVKISRSQIKGATTVLVLLGIGWIFGLLAIGPFEVFFRYLYCICNGGQGALIFIFRVLFNPHACKQWRRVLLGFSTDSSLDVSVTTTSSTASRKGNLKRKSTMISPSFISPSNSVENSLTASNPLSSKLASTLASILKAEDERAAAGIAKGAHCSNPNTLNSF